MPGGIPLIVVDTPLPVVVTEPGLRVRVQEPVEGRLLRVTLPVDTAHVGWTTAPTAGATGIVGAELITTSPEKGD